MKLVAVACIIYSLVGASSKLLTIAFLPIDRPNIWTCLSLGLYETINYYPFVFMVWLGVYHLAVLKKFKSIMTAVLTSTPYGSILLQSALTHLAAICSSFDLTDKSLAFSSLVSVTPLIYCVISYPYFIVQAYQRKYDIYWILWRPIERALTFAILTFLSSSVQSEASNGNFGLMSIIFTDLLFFFCCLI